MGVPRVHRAGPAAGPEAAFAELGRVPPLPLEAALGRVARLVRRTLPGAAGAAVTVLRPGGPAAVGCSGDVAAELDRAQYAAGAGPCVDAAARGGTVTVAVRGCAEPYRPFAAVAARHGITGVLAVGLPLDPPLLGSLAVYRWEAGGFDAAARDLARAFAGYVAGAVAGAAVRTQPAESARRLRLAMESRAVIEQAKGVLMARHGCTADEAFAMLVTESQRTNRKLRTLAADLVSSPHSSP
jgi:GAF domain-containing protein